MTGRRSGGTQRPFWVGKRLPMARSDRARPYPAVSGTESGSAVERVADIRPTTRTERGGISGRRREIGSEYTAPGRGTAGRLLVFGVTTLLVTIPTKAAIQIQKIARDYRG